MNHSDALDDFNTCEARTDIRCWTILIDPLEDVLDRASIFDPLTVTGDSCGRMKSRAHEFSVSCTRPSDITMNLASDGVVFGEIGIVGLCVRGWCVVFIERGFSRTLDAQSAPSIYFVFVRKDRVLLFMLATVNWQPLTRFPASNSTLAAVEVPSDLLPGVQSFLWGVPLRHLKTPAEDYTSRDGVAKQLLYACQWKAF